MQVRTSAQDYVRSGIYMTCVDTGWINDEKPVGLAVRHQLTADFQTPIDEVDACSRVLDPIISPLRAIAANKSESSSSKGLDEVEPPFGVFLKDFMKTEW